MLKANDFFTLPKDFPFKDYFSLSDAPWEWLTKIKDSLADYPFEDTSIDVLLTYRLKVRSLYILR